MPLFEPLHTNVVVLAVVPPTDTGSIVMVVEVELSAAQTPFVRTALKSVVAVMFA